MKALLILVVVLLSVGHATFTHANTAIETETAQIVKEGEIGFSPSYQRKQ